MDVLDKVRALLGNAPLQLGSADIISTGRLQSTDGTLVDYEIREGCNIQLGFTCDKLWRDFNVKLMAFIDKNVAEADRETVLDQIQIDDDHWEWMIKSAAMRTDEFRWFFLTANNEPQGACVIRHPKKSILNTGDIFYIEFIATAPWNRENPMEARRFRSVATLLIRCASKYAHDVLKLRYGFSLQAIERAVAYYQKLGMKPHPPSDQPPLSYYEMEEPDAKLLAGQ